MNLTISKKEIYLEKAGTLKSFLSDREKDCLTHLKISGFINAKDFDELDDMCSSWGSFDEDDNFIMDENEPPFLKILDLRDCTMAGKPVLGEFTYHSRLEEVILPKNLVSTGDMETFEESVFLTKVVLPETLKEIGYGSFINCEKLQDINLPEQLERIGDFAFSGCENLKTVKIPAKVKQIGCAAFGRCYNLERFDIDDYNQNFFVIDGVLFSKDKTILIAFPCGFKRQRYIVPEGVKIIADGSFLGSCIKSIIFPESLETIERFAFRGCDKLQTLDIPNSVREIGKLAFDYCSSLSKVKLSNKLSILKEQTFAGCNSLTEIEIPASVKKIEEYSLCWATNIENLIFHEGLEELNDDLKFTKIKKLYIPKTVKKIKSGLAILGHNKLNKFEFEVNKDNPYFCAINGSLYSKDTTHLIWICCPEQNKKFVVPYGVQKIEQFVFSGLKLEEIVLPQTLTTIGHRCFDGCKKLRKIILPKSLTSIDFRAFDDCKNLEIIVLEAVMPPEITDYLINSKNFMSDSPKLTLYVPQEYLEKYKTAAGWDAIKQIKSIKELTC